MLLASLSHPFWSEARTLRHHGVQDGHAIENSGHDTPSVPSKRGITISQLTTIHQQCVQDGLGKIRCEWTG